MSIPDKYLKRDSWPHKFSKTGRTGWNDKLKVPTFEYKCMHCKKIYWEGGEPRPLEPCPLRTDKRELERLGKRGADMNEIFKGE